MQREYHRWNSPSLRRDMELLVFGHGGIPVIVFPTSKGRFFDFENRGMVAAIGDVVDRGAYQLYCVDSVDDESWYNENAQPRERVARHLQYEQYILNEAIPFVRGNSQSEELFVTGCSFGGYHSVSFALRHPDRVDSCISMGGAFDIRPFLDGYYNEECYFNNPVDFLPNLSDPWYLQLYRTKVAFILATGEWDFCLDSNVQLSRMLDAHGVRHWLDVWGDQTKHDWPWWQMMIRKFLA